MIPPVYQTALNAAIAFAVSGIMGPELEELTEDFGTKDPTKVEKAMERGTAAKQIYDILMGANAIGETQRNVVENLQSNGVGETFKTACKNMFKLNAEFSGAMEDLTPVFSMTGIVSIAKNEWDHRKQLQKLKNANEDVAVGLHRIHQQADEIFEALGYSNCQLRKQAKAAQFTLKHFIRPLLEHLKSE